MSRRIASIGWTPNRLTLASLCRGRCRRTPARRERERQEQRDERETPSTRALVADEAHGDQRQRAEEDALAEAGEQHLVAQRIAQA